MGNSPVPRIIRGRVADPPNDNGAAFLVADATAKARKLAIELERQRQELVTAPPSQQLPPDAAAAGERAFGDAVAAVRRMIESLEGSAGAGAAAAAGGSADDALPADQSRT